MEMTFVIVAVLAIILAVILSLRKPKSSAKTSQAPPTPAAGAMAASPQKPIPPSLNAAKSLAKRKKNKKGWKAPAGHYFDEDDQLWTDAGELVEFMMVASLCGESYSEPQQEPVGTEAITPEPESEVTKRSNFADLQTAEPVSGFDSGGSYDSGSFD